MPQHTPDIAVVIPALNAAAHLRTALSSLAAQDADFEAVLVDGGSRDDTVAIADGAGVRVISAPGTSIYEAHNRGFAETSAPAIVLLNADDVLLPGALAAWRDALARAPQAGMARGRATFTEIDRAGVAGPVAGADERAAAPLDTDLLLRGPCAINSLCIRRTVFDRIGAFDTVYRLAADREWMLRAWIARVPLVEMERPVYRYLMHDGSSTIDRARRNFAVVRRENIDIAERYLAGPSARQADAADAAGGAPMARRRDHDARVASPAHRRLARPRRHDAAGLPCRPVVAAARRPRGCGLAVQESGIGGL